MAQPDARELDLSICIVNWNTRDLLRACLRSLEATITGHACERIVVDNASSDGSAAMVAAEFPRVHLIANRANLGYAAANNQAFRAARGRYLLTLNPDTVALPDTLDYMLRYMDAHPEVGVTTARLVYPDGSPQNSCLAFPSLLTEFADLSGLQRKYPRSPRWGRYIMAGWAHDETREVDQPMGTCLLARREVLEAVGGLDERFPLYFNDVDWCYRIKRAGWKIMFLAEPRLIHHRRAAGDKLGPRRIVEHFRGKRRYFRKHYALPGFIADWLLNVVFLGARYLRLRGRWQLARWRGRAAEDSRIGETAVSLKVYLGIGERGSGWRPPE
jgi:GT2 family glycosyltransferase